MTDLAALVEHGFRTFDGAVVSAQWTPAGGSRAALALEAQTVRYEHPWGHRPIDALLTYVSQSAVLMLDHARSAAHQLGADTSFSSMVLARSTAEAAGRIAWLVEDGLNLEEVVARMYAVKVTGLRAMVRIVELMLEDIAHGASGDSTALTGSLDYQKNRLTKILAEAEQIGVNVETRRDEVTGAVTITGTKLAPPPTTDLTILGLGHTGIAAQRSQVMFWSGIVHSFPWALEQFTREEGRGERGSGVSVEPLHSTPGQREAAAILAYLAVVAAATSIIDYYGWQAAEWYSWLRDGHQQVLRHTRR